MSCSVLLPTPTPGPTLSVNVTATVDGPDVELGLPALNFDLVEVNTSKTLILPVTNRYQPTHGQATLLHYSVNVVHGRYQFFYSNNRYFQRLRSDIDVFWSIKEAVPPELASILGHHMSRPGTAVTSSSYMSGTSGEDDVRGMVENWEPVLAGLPQVCSNNWRSNSILSHPIRCRHRSTNLRGLLFYPLPLYTLPRYLYFGIDLFEHRVHGVLPVILPKKRKLRINSTSMSNLTFQRCVFRMLHHFGSRQTRASSSLVRA
jgi:hypothetical protein